MAAGATPLFYKAAVTFGVVSKVRHRGRQEPLEPLPAPDVLYLAINPLAQEAVLPFVNAGA